MTGAVAAVAILFAIFGGLSLLAGVVGLTILVGSGKITIPGTHAHKVMAAQAATRILKESVEQEQMHNLIDANIQMRLDRAMLPPGEAK